MTCARCTGFLLELQTTALRDLAWLAQLPLRAAAAGTSGSLETPSMLQAIDDLVVSLRPSLALANPWSMPIAGSCDIASGMLPTQQQQRQQLGILHQMIEGAIAVREKLVCPVVFFFPLVALTFVRFAKILH